MKNPETLLRRLELRRAREQGFAWGALIGFTFGLGLFILLGRIT